MLVTCDLPVIFFYTNIIIYSLGLSWPGLSTWLDFLMPAARDYYASWHSYKKWNGTTPTLAGVWNDMNEPAVYMGVEASFPNNLVHRIDNNGTEVLHRDVHNLYGLMHVRNLLN